MQAVARAPLNELLRNDVHTSTYEHKIAFISFLIYERTRDLFLKRADISPADDVSTS